jgi:RNA polymerase sigma-70 factor (ECF subfamily)
MNEIRSTRRDLLRQRRDIRRERSLGIGQSNEDPTNQKAQPLDAADDLLTPATEALRRERLVRFHQALAKLPEDYAKVITWRGLEELPFNEVALRMDRSVDAVTKLFSRALIKLNEELNDLDESIA